MLPFRVLWLWFGILHKWSSVFTCLAVYTWSLELRMTTNHMCPSHMTRFANQLAVGHVRCYSVRHRSCKIFTFSGCFEIVTWEACPIRDGPDEQAAVVWKALKKNSITTSESGWKIFPHSKFQKNNGVFFCFFHGDAISAYLLLDILVEGTNKTLLMIVIPKSFFLRS